jgi:hypothetical protein
MLLSIMEVSRVGVVFSLKILQSSELAHIYPMPPFPDFLIKAHDVKISVRSDSLEAGIQMLRYFSLRDGSMIGVHVMSTNWFQLICV